MLTEVDTHERKRARAHQRWTVFTEQLGVVAGDPAYGAGFFQTAELIERLRRGDWIGC